MLRGFLQFGVLTGSNTEVMDSSGLLPNKDGSQNPSEAESSPSALRTDTNDDSERPGEITPIIVSFYKLMYVIVQEYGCVVAASAVQVQFLLHTCSTSGEM